jgi:hypothetical protein
MSKQLELMLQGIPLQWNKNGVFPSGRRDFSLEKICAIVAAMHHRGVVHGELTTRYVDQHNVYVSTHTGFSGRSNVYHYFYAVRNEEFDIFCLGILALLQHDGTAVLQYEKRGFPEHYYDDETFVGIESLPSYWKQCLHRDPSKRPSIWDAPHVKHMLLYPLPILPLNNCFMNEYLLTFSCKGYLHFDIARKYPANVIACITEEEFRVRVDRVAENVIEDSSLSCALLHHETLPLYYMLVDASLFHEAIQLLGKREKLSLVSDSYLLEFFCSYARSI